MNINNITMRTKVPNLIPSLQNISVLFLNSKTFQMKRLIPLLVFVFFYTNMSALEINYNDKFANTIDKNNSPFALSINARDDNGNSVNGFSGGISLSNVLNNDTLNGSSVTSNQVNTTFVSSTNSGVTLSGTSVVVAAGTPAGTYSLTYRICDKLNPNNCDTAIVRVIVTAAEIDAVQDLTPLINGNTGGVSASNVLINDTLNGMPVNPSDVNLTFVSSTNSNIYLSGVSVIIAPGTPQGVYFLYYQICDILNPNNCDTTSVKVNVVSPGIDANSDYGIPVYSATGGVSFTNVLINDTVNGVLVTPSQVILTFLNSTNPGVTLVGSNVVVAPGTPVGNYVLTYQICETIDPNNCDWTYVYVSVIANNSIIANDDTGNPVNGTTGGVGYSNVLINDTLNGNPVLASQVNTTFVSSTNPGITLSGVDVLVAAGTPSGTYTLTYQICEIVNPSNCDTAIVTIKVIGNPSTIIANDDTGNPVNGSTGGVGFSNVLINDTLNGNPVLASQVNTTFVSSTNPGITLSGVDVLVAAGTPSGTYTLTYQICEIVNPSNCDTAIVTICVNTAPSVGTITQPTCVVTTGSVVLNNLPTGTWTINPGNITGSTASTTITGLASGDYTFTVSSSAGCTSVASATVTINAVPNVPNAPSVGTITQPTCASPTGSVVLNNLPTGTWTINPGNITGSSASTTITGLASGDYTFTVSSSAGCTSVASATVTINAVPNVPNAPISSGNLVECASTPIQTISATTAVSVPTGQTIAWYDAASGGNLVLNPILNSIDSITYYAEAIDGICNSTTRTSVTLTINPIVVLTGRSADADCNDDDVVTFNLNTYLPSGILTTGTWYDVDNTLGLTNNIFSPFEVPIGDYLFRYVLENPGSCPTVFELTMTVDDDCPVGPCGNILVNQALTVNSSPGTNDFFIIEGLENFECFPTNSVEIYNRWGILVYETKQYDNATNKFTGESNGRLTVKKADQLPTGTYYYIINYSNDKGISQKPLNGYLYLTR